MTAPVDDEFTELVDADIPRVDLVDKAANGMRWLIAKRADGSRGLIDPDTVRALIAKAEPQPEREETVTMTGSPSAIVKLIHQAAQRATDPVAKAKYDADDLRRMATNGQAMADESYPIGDREDLDRAIRAVGRGGADHDAIRRHVIARAETLGASSEIPDNWNADGSLKGSVAKESDMADEDLDAATVLAEPDGEGSPGLATTPGSPAWEAIDAATARKWTSILARAKNAVELLADRELMESAAGAEDNSDEAIDLLDACCAIDYAIGVLAPFAVEEQSEADCGAESMAMVGKALHGWDPAALDTIEALGQVKKSGRVLSAANEAAIRGAVDSLQKVLTSLPTAPTTDDESGRPVAKTEQTEENTDMPEPTTSADTVAEHGSEPKMGIAKADGKPAMLVVFNEDGKPIGVIDPADMNPIANSGAAKSEPDGDGDMAADSADGAAPETSDLTPAPAGEVGTPADAVPDGVAKQTDNPDNSDTSTSDAVLKGIADVVKAQLDAHSAAQQEVLAKVAGDLAAAAETIEVLKGQVRALEEQPAEPKVFTNGAVPPPNMLRGQDRGTQSINVTKAQELKKGLYGAADAGEQNRIAKEMQAAAIDRLQEIHQRRA